MPAVFLAAAIRLPSKEKRAQPALPLRCHNLWSRPPPRLLVTRYSRAAHFRVAWCDTCSRKAVFPLAGDPPHSGSAIGWKPVPHREDGHVTETPMDPQANADGFLVEQIRDGSESAWRQLIDRYTGRLLAFARARTHSLADAEDLVQETFVGFLQSSPHYDAARPLETYLFTILRYKLYDLLRQRKAKVISEPPDAEGWWDYITPGTTETPSGLAVQAEAQQETGQLLGGILKQLIREMRDRDAFNDLQVIELAFFAGTRNLDIADLLDMDQKAVAGVKFRAIQKLRKFLAQRDADSLSCLDESPQSGSAVADVTVARVWREQRLTCLKRSTLGSYLLGVLDEPWRTYTQFHLDIVSCQMCLANLSDLEAEEDERTPADTERMFASSVGFLSRTK